MMKKGENIHKNRRCSLSVRDLFQYSLRNFNHSETVFPLYPDKCVRRKIKDKIITRHQQIRLVAGKLLLTDCA